MLTAEGFSKFFTELRGFTPFAWQQRLVDRIVESGHWPEAINAPTGAGKTSVIDVHLFVNAMDLPVRAPRLLALTVDRRALVDDHWAYAEAALRRLRDSRSGILNEVAARLKALSITDADEPFRLHRLRGGIDRDNSWRQDPTACRILCATPDMWGSRALFRGYGTSRLARPVDAGLLTYDSVLVVDEAHLNQQLVLTANEIGRLERHHKSLAGPRVLQVVSTTATQPGGDATEGVRESDMASDAVLSTRMRSKKQLTLVVTGTAERKRVTTLVEECLRLDKIAPPGTIGCVVDTVTVALSVKHELHRRLGASAASVESLVGRMRPFDTDRLREQKRGLFTTEGDPTVRFLVATQTIEVGVDMDLVALVTEIAPGSALAQRFGRLNRLGRRDWAEAVVVAPDKPLNIGPYREADIAAAMDWLGMLGDSGGSIAPWDLVRLPPPPATSQRALFQRLSQADAEHLSNTSVTLLTADPTRLTADDLSLWLQDDLDDSTEAFVVVRELPRNPATAARMLKETPPAPEELFRVRLSRAREIGQALTSNKDPDEIDTEVWVFSSETGQAEPFEHCGIAPAQVLVVSNRARCFTSGTADRDGETQSDVVAETHPDTAFLWVDAPDETQKELKSEKRTREVLAQAQQLQDPSGRLTKRARKELAASLKLSGMEGRLKRFLDRDRVGSVDVVLMIDSDSRAGMILARDAAADHWSSINQTWSPGDEVELAEHQEDVSVRAAALAIQLGFCNEVTEALRLAGLHHDDGKMDARFQTILGKLHGQRLLAKSGRSSPAERRRRQEASGLPAGWRHEQLSAAYAWANLQVDARALVARLVGTSHGQGRGSFRDGSEVLLGAQDDSIRQAARELFDEGQWEQIVEDTHQQFGYWRMAYLEAILRSADTSVSAEVKPHE